MSDDPLEWLSLSLQDDEPTIPDPIMHGWWSPSVHEAETGETNIATDETDEMDFEIESASGTGTGTRPVRSLGTGAR